AEIDDGERRAGDRTEVVPLLAGGRATSAPEPARRRRRVLGVDDCASRGGRDRRGLRPRPQRPSGRAGLPRRGGGRLVDAGHVDGGGGGQRGVRNDHRLRARAVPLPGPPAARGSRGPPARHPDARDRRDARRALRSRVADRAGPRRGGDRGGVRPARDPAGAPRRDPSVRRSSRPARAPRARPGRGGGGRDPRRQRLDDVSPDRAPGDPPRDRGGGASRVRALARRVRERRDRLRQHHRTNPDRAGPDLPARVPVQARAGGGRRLGSVRDLLRHGVDHHATRARAKRGTAVSAGFAIRRGGDRDAMFRRRRRAAVLRGMLVALCVLYLAVLLLAPLAGVVWQALRPGWRVLGDTFTRSDVVHAFTLTAVIALITVAVTTAFGVVVAWVLVRQRFRGRAFLNALVDLPFALSPVTVGLACVLLFGRGGWFHDFFAAR